jgi:hypothetical protein
MNFLIYSLIQQAETAATNDSGCDVTVLGTELAQNTVAACQVHLETLGLTEAARQLDTLLIPDATQNTVVPR